MAVDCAPFIRDLLRDDSLTRGLGDMEARMLVEWCVDGTESVADAAASDAEARRRVEGLFRRGRAIRQFVQLWCTPPGRGAAAQLAATERFDWPLLAANVEPPDLMHHILSWESPAGA